MEIYEKTSVPFTIVCWGSVGREGGPNGKDKEAQEVRAEDGGGVGWMACAILLVEDQQMVETNLPARLRGGGLKNEASVIRIRKAEEGYHVGSLTLARW